MKAIAIASALLALTACSNSIAQKANNDEIDALKARVEKIEKALFEPTGITIEQINAEMKLAPRKSDKSK